MNPVYRFWLNDTVVGPAVKESTEDVSYTATVRDVGEDLAPDVAWLEVEVARNDDLVRSKGVALGKVSIGIQDGKVMVWLSQPETDNFLIASFEPGGVFVTAQDVDNARSEPILNFGGKPGVLFQLRD